MKYYFISYTYLTGSAHGFGNMFISIKKGVFNLSEVTEHVKSKYNFKHLVILYFKEVTEEVYKENANE